MTSLHVGRASLHSVHWPLSESLGHLCEETVPGHSLRNSWVELLQSLNSQNAPCSQGTVALKHSFVCHQAIYPSFDSLFCMCPPHTHTHFGIFHTRSPIWGIWILQLLSGHRDTHDCNYTSVRVASLVSFWFAVSNLFAASGSFTSKSKSTAGTFRGLVVYMHQASR